MAWLEFLPKVLGTRHQRMRRKLSAYLDGDLAESEKVRVEQHLTECASCRRELESLRVTVGLLQELPQVQPPRSFVLERAPAPMGIWRWSSYDWAWASLKGVTVLAAVLLVAVVAGDITSQLGLPRQPVLEEAVKEKVVVEEALTRVVERPAEELVKETVVVEKPVEKVVTKVVEKEVVVETKVVEEALLEERPKAIEGFTPTPGPEVIRRIVKETVVVEKPVEKVVRETVVVEKEVVAEKPLEAEKVVKETVVVEKPAEVTKVVAKVAEVREVPAEKGVEVTEELTFARPASPPPPGAAISAVTIAQDVGAVETVITPEKEPTEVRASPTTLPPSEVAATPKPEAVFAAVVEEEEPVPSEFTGVPQLPRNRLWRWLEGGTLAVFLALGGFLWLAKRQRDALHL